MYTDFSSYVLQFVHDMEEFRYCSGHGLPLSALPHNEVRIRSPIDFHGFTREVLLINARVLHNKLYLRIQQ